MKTYVISKNPYVDFTYTGEWKLRREVWKDKHQFTEYYFGPFLIRHFHGQMDVDCSSIRSRG